MNLNETAPQGARISRADGSAVECDKAGAPKLLIATGALSPSALAGLG